MPQGYAESWAARRATSCVEYALNQGQDPKVVPDTAMDLMGISCGKLLWRTYDPKLLKAQWSADAVIGVIQY